MLVLLSSVYFLVHIQPILSQNPSVCGYEDEFLKCVFDQENSTRNRKNELRCCELVVNSFSEEPNHLSIYLNYLQVHNCPQLTVECHERILGVTPYTTYVYTRFCNASAFEAMCNKIIQNLTMKQFTKHLSLTKSWKNMVLYVDFLALKKEELMDPCIQIAMLEKEIILGSEYNFNEIKTITPFGGITWCGFSEQIIKAKSISPWTCIDKR